MILQSLLVGLWADPVVTEWWRLSVASRAGEERERERTKLTASLDPRERSPPRTRLFITACHVP